MLRLEAIPLGAAPPDDVNVFVTAGTGAEPYALRVDDTSGALTVTQLFHSAMRYPTNVGIIPHTLGETGDPLQAAVLTEHVFAPGMVVAVRPLAVLYVSGDEGEDIVVLSVPSARLSRRYEQVSSYTDLGQGQLRQIAHFFCHYRDMEERSRQRSSGWGDISEAQRVIREAAQRARYPVGLVD
jgi:inorganic pyrophosphatase